MFSVGCREIFTAITVCTCSVGGVPVRNVARFATAAVAVAGSWYAAAR
jgi:hypothetical protein